jgi:hypothetical protein
MIASELFQNVLINPINNGCNELLVATGYATSAMAFHHLEKLRSLGFDQVRVKLIIGMCSTEGMSLSNHSGFKQIMSQDFPNNFECSYRNTNPPFHTKLYIWLNNGMPVDCFLGSANYTQTAFNERKQKEALANCNPVLGLEYFNQLIDNSIYCTHPDSEDTIQIYNDKFIRRRSKRVAEEVEPPESLLDPNIESLESVIVSLLDRNGNMHNRAGLNWGQRLGREPNQAYLQLSPNVYKSNFFPLKSIHFTVLTDDHKTLICTRAHKNPMGAGIETPHNNSLIGEYFRNRLGLPNGAFVKKEDLIRYGRTDVTFYKIDDENYYMDFSV